MANTAKPPQQAPETAPQPAPKRGAKPAPVPAADASLRRVGPETERSHARRVREGFLEHYLGGAHVLDIGYRGGRADAEPVTAAAIGVELDYPGYDGVHLPFADESQDAVFASHCLEHIPDVGPVLADWFRVLKIGGYLVIAVPHQELYERKAAPPSRFNGDHKRFYTPRSLLQEMEASLPFASWRLRIMRDIDDGFDYSIGRDQHPHGCYEIEMVIEKITTPHYAADLRQAPEAAALCRFFADSLIEAEAARLRGDEESVKRIQDMLTPLPLPPLAQLMPVIAGRIAQSAAAALLRPMIAAAQFDEAYYLARHPDVRAAVEGGRLASGLTHYVNSGYAEGRAAQPVHPLFA